MKEQSSEDELVNKQTNSRPMSIKSLAIFPERLKSHLFRLHLDPVLPDSLPPPHPFLQKRQLNALNVNIRLGVAFYLED